MTENRFPRRRFGTASVSSGALAGVFGAAALLLLVGGLGEVGLTWDEPPYFDSAERLQHWVSELASGPDRHEILNATTVREVWDWQHYYNPHPPVYKEVMAATEAVAGSWLGRVAGFRLASLLEFTLLVSLVVLVAGRAWGTTAAVAAGVASLCMPRLVGHAHVAATDMPLTLFWFAATLGLAIGVWERSWRWGLLGAVAFGLAMGTKFTGYFVPLPVLAWILVVGFVCRHREDVSGWLWRALPRGLLLLGVAAVVAWAVNPLAWHDPIAYVSDLVRESLGRDESVPIATRYFGSTYSFVLPWHHAPVLTAITLPLGILVLGGIGAGATLRWPGRRLLGLLCVVQVLFFWVLLALPGSPNHDGVRLWLPVFPFVALLAGFGFAAAGAAVRRNLSPAGGRLGVLALAAVLFVPAALQVLAARPYYLAYYGELVGGPAGAAELGMEATYWYDALTPDFLEKVNRILPANASLAVFPTADHARALQRFGYLRADIEVQSFLPADYLLLYARKAAFDPVHGGIYSRVRPLRAVEYHGVELAGLYAWEEAAAREGRRTAGSGEVEGRGGGAPKPARRYRTGLP